jgi:signal transduction protein with GAF and PtsI domain
MSVVMSYRSLDPERRKAILEAMERVAAAPLEPDEVAEAAAREVKQLMGASRAWVEPIHGDVGEHPMVEELEDVMESISVPVEGGGRQIGLLTVAKDSDGDFSEADIEALRLLSRCVSSLLRGVSHHAETS